MESSIDKGITIVSAVGVAAYVAITLRHAAVFYLGFSGEQVRGGAMIAAIIVAALVTIDFIGRKGVD